MGEDGRGDAIQHDEQRVGHSAQSPQMRVRLGDSVSTERRLVRVDPGCGQLLQGLLSASQITFVRCIDAAVPRLSCRQPSDSYEDTLPVQDAQSDPIHREHGTAVHEGFVRKSKDLERRSTNEPPQAVEGKRWVPVSYTHLTLPTIYSV